MRFAAYPSGDLGFEQFCRYVRWGRRQHVKTRRRKEGKEGKEETEDVLIGSLAKHGIAALVPSRSFTFTMIIGSLVGASVGAAFFRFSFFGVSAAFVGGGGRSRSRGCRSSGAVLGFSFHLKPLLLGRGWG